MSSPVRSSCPLDILIVMQLTESPDGGCHVEHRLKVQPVLDAPALFSKPFSCTVLLYTVCMYFMQSGCLVMHGFAHICQAQSCQVLEMLEPPHLSAATVKLKA